MIPNLPEGIRFASFTRQKLWDLWEEMHPHLKLFGDDWIRDPEVFMKFILAPDTIVLESDFGLIFLARVREGLRAEVHLYFWDHKLSAHSEFFKEALLWGFLTYNLERVETFVPQDSRAVTRFLRERMGFKFEGLMRNRTQLGGRYINVEIYSILRDEVL